VIGAGRYGSRTPSTRRACSGYAIEPQHAQVADKESKLAAAATTLYNLARAVAPKFTDDTPEWS
jgi:hypothetical protein